MYKMGSLRYILSQFRRLSLLLHKTHIFHLAKALISHRKFHRCNSYSLCLDKYNFHTYNTLHFLEGSCFAICRHSTFTPLPVSFSPLLISLSLQHLVAQSIAWHLAAHRHHLVAHHIPRSNRCNSNFPPRLVHIE
jgi:hypothetical protein